MKLIDKVKASIFVLFICFNLGAQEKKSSPAETVTGVIGGSDITISYGSPSVKGRTIWGDLVPYGKVWRAGANEATTFETSKDISIGGQKLAAGKYSFFIIPEKDKATVIFNKEANQWGSYKYSSKKDAIRIDVKPTTRNNIAELLYYRINPADITLSWELWDIVIPVQ